MVISCGICRKSINSAAERCVKCSGTCGKITHAFCADLNLSYWRGWAAKVGLFWFCTECRRALEKGKTSGESDDTPLLVDLAKRVETIETRIRMGGCSEDETGSNSALDGVTLPVEVWTKVFQSLNVRQLRQVRLTCRSWNTIVTSCPALMDKIVVHLPKDIVLVEECDQVALLAASNSRFRHIAMTQLRVIRVDSWWPSVAENLESLSLSECQITITTLLAMLKPLHNLTSFKFSSGDYLDIRNCPLVVGFQLPSLKTLILQEVNHGELLDVFRQLCPRLKMFKLLSGRCAQSQPHTIAQFIEAVKGTLIGVELPMPHKLWSLINKIDEIHLKKVSLVACAKPDKMKEAHIIELCQKHPTVEYLYIPKLIISDRTTLEAISGSLTNLKRLTIEIGERIAQSGTFLNQFVELTELNITVNPQYSHNDMNISGYRNTNLTSISLTNVNIFSGSFNLFQNIRTLNLTKCRLANWSCIFDPQLKSLKSITLKSIEVSFDEDYLADYCATLQFLSISDCEIPKSLLIALFTLCPQLKVIGLEKVNKVSDDVVLVLSRNMKHLKKLLILDCGDVSVLCKEYVLQNCPQIEVCHIQESYQHTFKNEFNIDHIFAPDRLETLVLR